MNPPHSARNRALSLLRGTLAALLSLSLLLAGCTTLRTTSVPSGQAGEKPAIKVGSHIVAHTRDGQAHAFKVTAIEPTAFVGEHEKVSFEAITQLEVKKIEPVGTTILVVSGVALVVIIAAAASGGIAFMPGGPVM
ncbi:MAG: hypothetical protein JSR48_13095 [Verrucomicrobia bacterium]|nr:hypothetical protein [Verrucomicrobiota bacterium]